jgi:hypothetical protein
MIDHDIHTIHGRSRCREIVFHFSKVWAVDIAIGTPHSDAPIRHWAKEHFAPIRGRQIVSALDVSSPLCVDLLTGELGQLSLSGA